MPHLLGYARVSTADQNPDLQLDALRAAGCYRLFVDTASGALDERPQLARILCTSGQSVQLFRGRVTTRFGAK